MRNLNILNQSKGSPPDLIGDVTLEKIQSWYDQEYSIIQGKRNQSSMGITKTSTDIITRRY
jgi:hypothetical protein